MALKTDRSDRVLNSLAELSASALTVAVLSTYPCYPCDGFSRFLELIRNVGVHSYERS